MKIKDPFNVNLMNVDKFIEDNLCLQVTSHNIYKASTTNFHPDGLFSEEIFGQIGTEQRLTKFGYIKLNMNILHPLIYQNITVQFTQLYSEILTNKSYVVFDEEEKNFVLADRNDPKADTGYTFFMKHFNNIKFKETDSKTRQTKIDLINRYKDTIFLDKYLIIPAGVRDVKVINDRIDKEKINSLYLSLLSLAQSVPSGMMDDSLFDGIKLSIQLKANEIYHYILERWIEGKHGFLQDKYTDRAITLSTRNVITAADMNGTSSTDPSFLKMNETQVPLIQSIKMFQPLVYFILKSSFIEPILSESYTNIPLIDPKTLNLVFKPIDEKEKNNYLTSEGIDTLINRFTNKYIRNKPFTIQTEDNSFGYLYLVYEYEDKLFIFRNIEEFELSLSQTEIPLDKTKIRPITYIEIFYLVTYRVTMDKYMIITRYPVTSIESTYPSKVKVVSTINSKKMTLVSFSQNELIEIESYPHYPILNEAYIDSLVIHPCKLDMLGGDFDGDTVSAHGILSEEANNEIAEYFNSKASIISPSGKLLFDFNTYLNKYVLFNLSKPTRNYTKERKRIDEQKNIEYIKTLSA